jgi:isoquinoline 1-oxidoreductase subunit beta
VAAERRRDDEDTTMSFNQDSNGAPRGDAAATVSRRTLLKTVAYGTGAFVLALHLPGCSKKAPPVASTGPLAPNAWLTIAPDDSITFLCDKSEMGQGVYTALPMMIAEELGVDVGRIKVEFAPPGDAFINNLIGGQVTGGSTSVRDAWPKLRKAGAQAREMLVAAAATQWGVAAADCRVDNGTVVAPDGKSLTFGALAGAASKLPVPAEVKLKDAAAFAVIGTTRQRLDTPMKVDGSAQYGIDVRLPGMLYAALAQPPVLGGEARSFDAAAAKAMPGVRDVLMTSSGVAVVADSWWQARQARDALTIDWDAGANAKLDDAAIRSGLKAASAQAGIAARSEGDAAAALKSAARVVKAEYELPLLAHATLEPQNCTADVRADGCDLYVPTQVQGMALAAASKAAGLPPEKVRVHTTFLGGGFGRRLEVDFIPAAVEVSKAIGKPVKLLWTREDDTTHDAYRPPAYDTCAGGFDADGKLVAWKLHLTGPSITERVFPGAVPAGAADPFAVEAAANYPYDVPNVAVSYVRHEIGIDVGYWRSVSHALNCFVAESFMDELALAASKDPVEFRMALLEKQPRYRAVLERATKEAGYGKPPAGRFHGVALMEGYGTYMAQVAEISLEQGKLRVHRIVCALDCGQMINPSIVTAQVESSIAFGLTAALWGEINLKGGRVQQSNFDGYRLLRINEAPQIDTHIIASGEAPGGIGEPATALVAPAICNALFTATGRRVRSLPLSRHKFA